MKDTNYYIPEPPSIIYLHNKEYEATIDDDREKDNSHAHTARMVLFENNTTRIIDHIEFDNGIFVYYKDVDGKPYPYPKKGFPTPESVASINRVKRFIMESVLLAGKPQFLISWVCIILSSKRGQIIDSLLHLFNKYAYPLVANYLIVPVLMTEIASEFQGIIHGLLLALGVSREESAKFAQTMGAIIQYDDAYRLRLEDLFSETTQERLESNPYKECNRLFKIYCERERMAVVKVKFQRVFKILSLPLLIPTIKDAFIKAVHRSEFKRLQYDDIDSYWCKLRSDDDYYYQGKTHKERMGELKIPHGVQIVI